MNTQSVFPRVYKWTGPTGVAFRDIRQPSGTYYRDTTPRKVIDALEAARGKPVRVRVHLGDPRTAVEWPEQYDVTGYVGRSMGPLKVPLLLPRRTSDGGPAIMTDCILRLVVDGREVYRHPRWKPLETHVRPEADHWLVTIGERIHGREKTEQAAERLALFLAGIIHTLAGR